MAPKRKSFGGPGSNLKQGSLFSFFSQKSVNVLPKAAPSSAGKEPPNADAAAAERPSSSTNAASASNNSSKNAVESNPLLSKLAIGSLIEVYWPDDETYYGAKVIKKRDGSAAPRSYYVEYDDGQCEWVDLGTEKFRFTKSTKRRRIQQQSDDDEGEFEFEIDADEDASESEESAYDDAGNNEDEEEEDDDQWMVSDEEDAEVIGSKKAKKKRTKTIAAASKVTMHEKMPSGKTPSRNQSTTTPAARTPTHVTPTFSGTTATSSAMSTLSNTSSTKPLVSATPMARPYSNAKHSPAAVPMYAKGAVNPAGSHVHNHLKFLHPPRDALGRTPDHELYDARTLRIVHADWEQHVGKMTDAVKQWWDLKAQYFDTVLLFKTGKFYEMFHMDADVGVQVLGLLYMKGHVAHAGFPEISYGSMADKLVRAGYKVARVEQTETPAQLQERKKKHRGGKKPKVVNREVCSILTLGTRTFCYLDDEKGLLEETSSDGSGVIGPLLAIREIQVLPNDEETGADDVQTVPATADESSNDTVRPVCEYGITMVDAVRGQVTLGQFADDVLRSRMDTLLTAFRPSEILLQGGREGASSTLVDLIRSFQSTSRHNLRVETIREDETFPKSTAIDPAIRQQMERRTSRIHPWDVNDTLEELHRRGYYPRASKKQEDRRSVSRWPPVLRAAVDGGANLSLSSFGACLFYLQRNLIDNEILSLGIVKAYVPPASPIVLEERGRALDRAAEQEQRDEAYVADTVHQGALSTEERASRGRTESPPVAFAQLEALAEEETTTHLSLDGTTLHNLEILTNSVDYKPNGSLWSLINHTKTPHGSRLLRAWLLRPLFRKVEIDRRADAVQELTSGAAAVAMADAASVLAKCGDIERLLSRVHSMSGSVNDESEGRESASFHPNERAILYEMDTYTKRKVADFSKVLNGLRLATRIPEIFDGIDISSGLLKKVVQHPDRGGVFPNMVDELDWFFMNFDCDLAAKGQFEPAAGVDQRYDEAYEAIERINEELSDYKDEMCTCLSPRSLAKSSWKYINTKADSKDKFLIELPAQVAVPDDFILKGKRGKGPKQVNKYRTAFVERLVQELEIALDVQKDRKARGMQLIFARFDAMRALWATAAKATSLLDALGSLARVSANAGYSRPEILDCPPDSQPSIKVTQGRHPCVEKSLSSGDFVPNDLALGGVIEGAPAPRVLLLSGVNMGGKSTTLRQTCLIAILAQIGCFVPAEQCSLTPVNHIYTRLGASDRILLGQSTFFVELAETAAALRGATRRSLVIMDELGRGTSTFDGTAIASAAVKHLVERSRCLSLFATHYHSLLEEWDDNANVRLAHMEVCVDGGISARMEGAEDRDITFLYTLGSGGCPKSFGINVARLAGLPPEVLSNAKRISSDFENQMNGTIQASATTARSAPDQKRRVLESIEFGDWESLSALWNELQR